MFPHLGAAVSEVGRIRECRRLYTGSHLSTLEKSDLHRSLAPSHCFLTAHQLSASAPGFTLAAEVRIKGDTVVCVNAEGTNSSGQTVETSLIAEALMRNRSLAELDKHLSSNHQKELNDRRSTQK